ncbi:hypothetical protein OBBRIDRAFT_885313 [Obba rivulosa]|uniref:DNA-directed RNA polymerase III subunit RPC4 n=1 Tax=Obba rivulosa TaxID=1052685 RepID=A0A8E2DQ40_9APHY|nr:hypothetical protein OBBRIDRAFT_885313 [Obba rivulosa]
MSEPSGSGQPPKAIASLAKKPSDTTRGGGSRLKFVPTIPSRRTKVDVKQEEAPAAIPTGRGERGRGRGQDRGRGRGRGGEGRGGPPRPPAVEMTASGPFAMGPTLAGTSARRTTPRSNFTPIVPQGPNGPKLGAGLTQTTAPTLKREKGEKEQKEEDEAEVYSDPDEGVEIVDMDDIKKMDWMAPESLRKEKEGKKKKKVVKVKEEERPEPVLDRKGKGVAVEEAMDVDEPRAEEVNLANAVDLSESEEEEELEDIIDDFSLANETEEDSDARRERLYFFQFPSPFPTFVSRTPQTAAAATDSDSPKPEDSQKKVTFALDTKPPAAGSSAGAAPGTSQTQPKAEEEPKVDGVIGQLEIYQSGAVKMRLANGILLDVSAATQPSFLQQAVHIDPTNKRICVLGEVNRRFVVSPDIDALLSSMELADNPPPIPLDEGLITMDTS